MLEEAAAVLGCGHMRRVQTHVHPLPLHSAACARRVECSVALLLNN